MAVRHREDGWGIAAVALAVRVAVALRAAPRFPPVADGAYYDTIARRIAAGLGYTWLWPDGVVTYAAHYPVGYPAAVGALYAIFGPRPLVAMLLNALLGALSALAVHRLAVRADPSNRKVALVAALLVGLHPGLVAYTPALMTEGVAAALIAAAAWATAWARDVRDERPFGGPAVVGAILGLATLVRPQCLAFAPVFALVVVVGSASPRPPLSRPVAAAAVAVAIALAAAFAVCAPWTVRNCVRMQRCAVVSVNGGWNLLIGADPASTGTFAPVNVPEVCKDVFDEAGKDVCFEHAARRYILEHPGDWLALVPKKLAATFDYAGAAGWYLNEANPQAFDQDRKIALGAVETVYERVVLLLGLVWAGRREPGEPRSWSSIARLAVALAGAGFAVSLHAWVGYAGLALAALLRGRRLWAGPVLPGAATAVLLVTMATHAVFFGAGRYSLVVFPLLCGVAAMAFRE